MTEDKAWETYEQVAVYLLNQLAAKLGLDYVEGKQAVIGNISGVTWEIDGKGVAVDGEGFVILECRRTKSKQKQEQVAALAFCISDTGAGGGIIVTPVGLQAGAIKVAECANICVIKMDENSTRTDYMFRFLNKTFIGVSDTAHSTATASVRVIRGSSN